MRYDVILLAISLVACSGTKIAAPDRQVEAAPQPTMPPPASADFPDAMIVSTNEPFWQARIGEGTVVLKGVAGPDRRLTVTGTSARGSTRRIEARDGKGRVTVTLRNAACEDSMSGAHFPFSGAIVFDGGAPIEGCARSAAAPPPRG